MAQAREARGESRIDVGAGGVDDQPAGRDRELLGGAAIAAELGIMGEHHAAVHQDDDDEHVVGGERRGAPGRGPAPLDGRARDEHERSGGIGQGGAVGKVLGHGLPRVEVPPREADHGQRHHAQAVDAPAEGHRRFFSGECRVHTSGSVCSPTSDCQTPE